MKRRVFGLAGANALSASPTLARERATTHKAMLRYRAAELTVQGIVEELKPHSNTVGLVGAYLVRRTLTQALNVHLGTSCTTEGQFTPGQRVQVSGSTLSQQHGGLFLARQIKKRGAPNPYDLQLARPSHKREGPAVPVADAIGVRR